VFVKPPREEEDDANLWLLMAAVYGLVDSGRLWYLTSSEAMQQFGLSCSLLHSCTWTLKDGNNVCLIVSSRLTTDCITVGQVTIRGLLCATKDETSVDTLRRMFCCNFLRKSRL
jgi:hypothetical protein